VPEVLEDVRMFDLLVHARLLQERRHVLRRLQRSGGARGRGAARGSGGMRAALSRVGLLLRAPLERSARQTESGAEPTLVRWQCGAPQASAEPARSAPNLPHWPLPQAQAAQWREARAYPPSSTRP
jgi:hypothetical protein